MRIESEVKLGFKDVMIRPKRSTIKSRAEVSLLRSYKKTAGLGPVQLWGVVRPRAAPLIHRPRQ